MVAIIKIKQRVEQRRYQDWKPPSVYGGGFLINKNTDFPGMHLLLVENKEGSGRRSTICSVFFGGKAGKPKTRKSVEKIHA